MLGELYQATGATPELFHKFLINSASSEMSKASRRKQSKPNRLTSEEGGVQHPPLPGLEQHQQQNASPRASPRDKQLERQEEGAKDAMDLSTKTSSPRPEADANGEENRKSRTSTPPSTVKSADPVASGEMQMVVNFPCHTCGEMFVSRALQELHIAEKHTSEAHLNKSSPPGPIFPTAYHKLATELGLGALGPSMIPGAASKQMEGLKSQTTMSNSGVGVPKAGTPGVGGKGTAGSVFQREAYCEICQREFCNKYFLKTHKANIHGIIDPNDPKSAAVAAKINQPPKLTQPPSTESLISTPQKPAGSVGKPAANDSMDDFCEICQKHFCNKYYLKKHKVDVHNLRPDGSKPSQAPDRPAEARGLPPGMPPSNPLPLPMMVPQLSNLNPTSLSNMLLVNPFGPSMAAMSMVPHMMQPQFLMHNMSGLAAAHAASQAMNHSPEVSKDMKKDLVKMEKPESPSQQSDKPDEAFCTICKKEFCNSYYLQLHLASKHGLFDEAATSALLMMAAEREKLERENQSSRGSASPSPTNLSNTIKPTTILSSDKDRAKMSPAFSLNSAMTLPPGLTPSFDAMQAAKQADRITCDICNKEVCNKYFLKAHKLKMHGVSSPTDEKQLLRDNSSSGVINKPSKQMTPPRPASLNPTTTGEVTHQAASAAEDLLKIGIDPESYCLLCKKEFCSKYFLRTHMLNIHGIKSDERQLQQQTIPKGTITPPTSISPTLPFSMTPSPNLNTSSEHLLWKWREQQLKGLAQGMLPENLQLPVAAAAAPPSGDNKFTWRWKETSNSARVFCDICNKELCNKYFLRTHKLKIHGIADEGGASSPPKSNRGSMMAENSPSQISAENQDSMSRSDANMSADAAGSMAVRSGLSSPTASDKAQSLRDDVCQVCGMVFPDSDAVSDHIKLEHSSEDIEVDDSKKQGSPEKDNQMYRCTQCPYQTSVLSNIYSHEARKHNSEMNTCKTCQVTFSHVHMLVKHMRQIHGKTIASAALKKFSSDIKRRVQCNFCSERFLNRQLCQSHIRNTHGVRIPLTSKTNVRERRVFACDKCRYICKSIKNLRMHQTLRHRSASDINNQPDSHSNAFTMQEFTVQSVTGLDTLASQTLQLPVYSKVKDDMQLNLTLIPTRTLEDGEEDSMDTTSTS